MDGESAPIGAVTGCGPTLPIAAAEAKPLRQQIFEYVRGAGQVSRVDIARALEISPGSVTALSSDLISAGYLGEVEGKPKSTGRGRPPVDLKVSGEAQRVIGIKFSDVRSTAFLADFSGNEIAYTSTDSTPVKYTVAQVLDDVRRLIDDLLDGQDLTPNDIAALGIGIPGVVNHNSGIVVWSPLITGRDIPLQAQLTETFGIPTHIENDANVLTLAELWFGAGRSMENFAVVTIEHGVGMGLVLNNRLFRGAQGLGLELGHTKVQPDGALCRCGQRGCLEAYIADYALVREASTALNQHPSKNQNDAAMLESLFDQAKAGNQAARAIFHRAARYLSHGVANVIQLFDPELIILSGERLRYDYLYAEDVLADMQALTLDPDRPRTRIEINSWGDLVWARGAAALALDHVTDRIMGEFQ